MQGQASKEMAVMFCPITQMVSTGRMAAFAIRRLALFMTMLKTSFLQLFTSSSRYLQGGTRYRMMVFK